jgi:hypothetical protein
VTTTLGASPAKTARDALTAARIPFGQVRTRHAGGHSWLVACVHRDDTKAATAALTAAFPGHLIQSYTSEVRVRTT